MKSEKYRFMHYFSHQAVDFLIIFYFIYLDK